MEDRKAWVGRLSQTGRDGRRQQTWACTDRPRWVDALFPETKQCSGWPNWEITPTPRRTIALRTECWPVTEKAKKGKKKIESLFFLLFFFFYFFFLLKKNYLFIWLQQVLVVARRIFSCSLWDLVPWPGIEPQAPCIGSSEFSHWATRKIPSLPIFKNWSIIFIL